MRHDWDTSREPHVCRNCGLSSRFLHFDDPCPLTTSTEAEEAAMGRAAIDRDVERAQAACAHQWLLVGHGAWCPACGITKRAPEGLR